MLFNVFHNDTLVGTIDGVDARAARCAWRRQSDLRGCTYQLAGEGAVASTRPAKRNGAAGPRILHEIINGQPVDVKVYSPNARTRRQREERVAQVEFPINEETVADNLKKAEKALQERTARLRAARLAKSAE